MNYLLLVSVSLGAINAEFTTSSIASSNFNSAISKPPSLLNIAKPQTQSMLTAANLNALKSLQQTTKSQYAKQMTAVPVQDIAMLQSVESRSLMTREGVYSTFPKGQQLHERRGTASQQVKNFNQLSPEQQRKALAQFQAPAGLKLAPRDTPIVEPQTIKARADVDELPILSAKDVAIFNKISKAEQNVVLKKYRVPAEFKQGARIVPPAEAKIDKRPKLSDENIAKFKTMSKAEQDIVLKKYRVPAEFKQGARIVPPAEARKVSPQVVVDKRPMLSDEDVVKFNKLSKEKQEVVLKAYRVPATAKLASANKPPVFEKWSTQFYLSKVEAFNAKIVKLDSDKHAGKRISPAREKELEAEERAIILHKFPNGKIPMMHQESNLARISMENPYTKSADRPHFPTFAHTAPPVQSYPRVRKTWRRLQLAALLGIPTAAVVGLVSENQRVGDFMAKGDKKMAKQ